MRGCVDPQDGQLARAFNRVTLIDNSRAGLTHDRKQLWVSQAEETCSFSFQRRKHVELLVSEQANSD